MKIRTLAVIDERVLFHAVTLLTPTIIAFDLVSQSAVLNCENWIVALVDSHSLGWGLKAFGKKQFYEPSFCHLVLRSGDRNGVQCYLPSESKKNMSLPAEVNV